MSAAASSSAAASDLWNGYRRLDFTVAGRSCLLVLPATPAPGQPWTWRTEFFGHEPQAEIGLLAQGFHVAYMDVQNLYGAPVAMQHMDAFYEHLTAQYGLSARCTLIGFSRGGLFALNWAARHPERIACLYLDAPVCDFRSWPGGKGRGPGSPEDWRRLLEVYGLSEAEALAWPGNPVDNTAPLARANIPILSVCGEADEVVPITENTCLLAQRYRAQGGDIQVVRKPHCDHHPHSLRDPALIVNYVCRHTPGLPATVPAPVPTPYGYDYFSCRDGLPNCRLAFARGQARVAFLGGSITAAAGWRDLVARDLQRRFPGTVFDFVTAGIPSLDSTAHACRYRRDVLARGPVDLLFVEAAVNDSTNGKTDQEQQRGMEGIVRQARLDNPLLDIVLLHFVDPAKRRCLEDGQVPAVIANHEQVAAAYGLPSLDLAREITERLHAGEFTWEHDFRDLHPSPFGHELYARAIGRLFDAVWAAAPAAAPRPGRLPEKPLDEGSYWQGRLLPLSEAAAGPGWQSLPAWHPADQAGTRAGFVDVPALAAEHPGASLRLRFRGTAVGLFVAAGPDAGTVEYRLDGGPLGQRDLFTVWSAGLHLPWAVMLAAGLPAGEHELELRVAAAHHPHSRGHAVRIIHFLAS